MLRSPWTSCLLPIVALIAPMTTAAGADPQHPFANAFVAASTRHEVTILAVGNSVTAADRLVDGRSPGFWQVAADWFQAHFPDAQVHVERSIIYAVGPEVQVFRFDDEVVAKHPDLVITEFAAADTAWGERGRAVTEPAAEGWIRRLRREVPRADCVLMLSPFQTMLDDYRDGRQPAAVSFLVALSEAYGCAYTDAQAVIARRVLAGEPWQQFMDDVIHPNAGGYAVHGDLLTAALDRAYESFMTLPAGDAVARDHALPDATLVAQPWQYARLAPAWLASDCAGFRLARRGRLTVLEADHVGAHGVFTPGRGRVVGWYLRHPEHQAACEVTADGGPWTPMPLGEEPVFGEKDDPDDQLQRQFFVAYGLPATIRSLAFRVPAGAADDALAQIAGFFVVEREVDEPGAP